MPRRSHWDKWLLHPKSAGLQSDTDHQATKQPSTMATIFSVYPETERMELIQETQSFSQIFTWNPFKRPMIEQFTAWLICLVTWVVFLKSSWFSRVSSSFLFPSIISFYKQQRECSWLELPNAMIYFRKKALQTRRRMNTYCKYWLRKRWRSTCQ